MSQLENKFAEPYAAWQKAQNQQTRQAMVAALMPVIQQSVISAGGAPDNPVVLSKAKLMALDGLRKYNPEKAALSNYMYSHLRGLNRVIGTERNIIQTPESVVLDRQRLQRAEAELFDELGRYPSSAEIANRSGISLKRMAKLRQAHVPVTENQVNTVFGEGNSPAVQRLGESTQDDEWKEYVYDSIPERQQAVMERIYGMHGFKPMAAKDIASKLKISTAAVSQHRKKIDEMLNSELQETMFGND